MVESKRVGIIFIMIDGVADYSNGNERQTPL